VSRCRREPSRASTAYSRGALDCEPLQLTPSFLQPMHKNISQSCRCKRDRGSSRRCSLRFRSGARAPGAGCTLGRLETTVNLVPLNVGEERVEIARDCSSKVDLITVLVHVHHEERYRSRQDLRVIARADRAQLTRIELHRQHDPTAATTEPRSCRAKVLLPKRTRSIRL
jgi:hypothetical protein